MNSSKFFLSTLVAAAAMTSSAYAAETASFDLSSSDGWSHSSFRNRGYFVQDTDAETLTVHQSNWGQAYSTLDLGTVITATEETVLTFGFDFTSADMKMYSLALVGSSQTFCVGTHYDTDDIHYGTTTDVNSLVYGFGGWGTDGYKQLDDSEESVDSTELVLDRALEVNKPYSISGEVRYANNSYTLNLTAAGATVEYSLGDTFDVSRIVFAADGANSDVDNIVVSNFSLSGEVVFASWVGTVENNTWDSEGSAFSGGVSSSYAVFAAPQDQSSCMDVVVEGDVSSGRVEINGAYNYSVGDTSSLTLGAVTVDILDGETTFANNGAVTIMTLNVTSGDATFSGSGTTSVTTLNVTSGDATFSGSGTTSVTTLNLTGGDVTFSGAGDSSVAGVVSGAGSLTKSGSGTLTLSGNSSSYTGQITISEGTLKLGGLNAVLGATDASGDGDRYIVVENTGILDINGKTNNGNNCYKVELNGGKLVNNGDSVGDNHRQITGIKLTKDSTIAGSSNFGLVGNQYCATTLDLGGNTLTKDEAGVFTLTNTTITAGTVKIVGGKIQMNSQNGAQKSDGSAADFQLEGGELNLNGRDFTVKSLSGTLTTSVVALGNNSLTIVGTDTGTDYYTYAGSMTSTGGTLIKQGNETLELSGEYVQIAATRIEDGTLVAHEGYVSLGSVEVSADATLKAVVGTSEMGLFTTTVTFADDAKFAIDLRNTGTPLGMEDVTLAILSGTITFGENTTLTSDIIESYFSADESVLGMYSDHDREWNYADNVLSLTFSAPIPEPSAFGLLAGVGALALVAARRRRRK